MDLTLNILITDYISRTLSIQKFADAKLIFGDIKGIVKVSHVVVWVQFVVIDDVGSMGMDKCVEAQSIPPTGAEVLNINAGISVKRDISYH